MRVALWRLVSLAAILAVLGFQAYVHRNDIANVYVWAIKGSEHNILSFTAGQTTPNLIYAGRSLPPDVDMRSVVMSSDGRSLVSWRDPATTGTHGFVYGRFPLLIELE